MPTVEAPPAPLTAHPRTEMVACMTEPAYFVDTYVQIFDATLKVWVPFILWPAQVKVLEALTTGQHFVILKARQLGLSWLVLAYILAQMIFHPAPSVILFSKRQEEAWHLLERLKGMYDRLPAWMHTAAGGVVTDNNSVWALGNGSIARAFPSTGADSYTASIMLVDEADLLDNQAQLLTDSQPTIDGGGQLILLSRAEKDHPDSPFKRRYLAAKAGALAGWRAIFLPWFVRPGRTPAWYAARKAESLAQDGTLDAVHEQYPATDAEALAQLTGDKRLPPDWLLACYTPAPALLGVGPGYAGLTVYALPVPGAVYVVGADPAEGNPHSDDSAATVLDRATGVEVAALVGKIEPVAFARQLAALSAWYNNARIVVERNNHGHTVIAGLPAGLVLPGPDGKPGYLTTNVSKPALYDFGAPLFRDQQTTIRSLDTFTQLGSIEGNTLSAPAGQHDDRAMSYLLALWGRVTRGTPAARQYNYLDTGATPDGY